MTPDLILLEQDEDADLPAGEFADWLTVMARALSGKGESDVPCGDCNACCRSSYFIELKPTDTAARGRIPAALVFDAPGAPAGYQVLGYDEAGRCPMLQQTGCTIYADRPLTCRTYDCRIFAATGIAEAAPEKTDVTARAKRWRFSYRDAESQALHNVLKLGTRLLVDLQQRDEVATLPRSASQIAMLAVQLHRHFQAAAPLLEQAEDAFVSGELAADILEAARNLMSSR